MNAVKRMGVVLGFLGLSALGAAEPLWAQQCDETRAAATPTARFQLSDAGTAVDTKTGLMWMRCAVGQRWAGGHCSIDYEARRWVLAAGAADAVNAGGGFAGHRDWRLPDLEELAGLVESRCIRPAINLAVFPEAPITGYWSATPDADYSRGAWLVHFLYGGSYMSNKSQTWALRLVRGR